MKHVALLAFALLALPALGQETQTAPPPDYSKDTLIRIFSEEIEPPKREGRIRWTPAGLEFTALNTRWRITPVFMPLPGSVRNDVNWDWPDPFALTGTTIAHTPRTWRDTRAMSRELREFEKRVRNSQTKVKVKTD